MMDKPAALSIKLPHSIAWRIAGDVCTLSVFGLGLLAIFNTERPPLFLAIVALAGLLDGFDGVLARRSGAPSLHGTILDVVADGVAFGLAPIVFSLHQEKLSGILFWAGSSIYISASLWRLVRSARLYLQKPSGYLGLPMPETGNLLTIFAILLPPAGFIATLVGLSALAVSRLPYPSLTWLWKHDRRYLVFVALLVACLSLAHYSAGLLAGLLVYVAYPWLEISGK